MLVHYFQIIQKNLYVCQSISWLTYLRNLGQYRDISCSGWDIFQKFLSDIPRMFVHYFQIIQNFLYVCQPVSWLTSLLKLDKYGDISSYGWYIFSKLFGDMPRMLVHYFLIILNIFYVCQSVRWQTFLLKLC